MTTPASFPLSIRSRTPPSFPASKAQTISEKNGVVGDDISAEEKEKKSLRNVKTEQGTCPSVRPTSTEDAHEFRKPPIPKNNMRKTPRPLPFLNEVGVLEGLQTSYPTVGIDTARQQRSVVRTVFRSYDESNSGKLGETALDNIEKDLYLRKDQVNELRKRAKGDVTEQVFHHWFLNNRFLQEAMSAFRRYDEDGSGHIDRHELPQLLVELSLPEDMLLTLDTDGDDKVSFMEFLQFTMKRNHQQAHQVFKRYDKDGNGVISVAELRLLLVDLGEDVSTRSVRELIQKLDKGRRGAIVFEEFSQWYEEQEDLQDCMALFIRHVDYERINSPHQHLAIRGEDLPQLLMELGITENPKVVLKSIDTDKNGEVELDEFVKWFMHSRSTRRLREIFRNYALRNIHANGQLRPEDVHFILKDLGLPSDSSDVARVFSDVDADGSGSVSLVEFMSWCVSLSRYVLHPYKHPYKQPSVSYI